MGPLQLTRACFEQVVEHCRQRFPKEACGYLSGRGTRVEKAYPMVNVEDSPIGYSMNPKEQLQVEKRMRQEGLQLVAIYHSHTSTDAYPSPVDVRLAVSPDVSYALVSLKDPDKPVLRSFRIDGTAVTEEPVQIG